MFHVSTLKNRFKLRVDDFSKIAEYLNNLCGGMGIKIKRPDNPSASNPPVVEISREELADMLKELLASSEPQNPTELPSGEKGDTALDANDTATWTAGGPTGLLIYLPCKSESAGNRGRLHWRPFKITSDGRIFSVGEESAYTKYYANV